MSKQLITANDILKAAESMNKILNFREEECIVTPGARDKIEEMGVRFATDFPDSPARERQLGTESGVKPTGAQKPCDSDSRLSRVASITCQVCSLIRERLPLKSVPGLESLVQKVVESRLSKSASSDNLKQSPALTAKGGVLLINGKQLLDECSGANIPGKVLISDAIHFQDASQLSATYMKWEKTSFSRTVESQEISIIVEGELDLVVDGDVFSARAGDILYLPGGITVTYNSPSMVKLACVSEK
jgi:ethanolamine utilization protein EutQ